METGGCLMLIDLIIVCHQERPQNYKTKICEKFETDINIVTMCKCDSTYLLQFSSSRPQRCPQMSLVAVK